MNLNSRLTSNRTGRAGALDGPHGQVRFGTSRDFHRNRESTMSYKIEFTAGLPPLHCGPCIFLMWDGSVCEGGLHTKDGRQWLVTHSYADPTLPQRVEIPADGGKVLGFALAMPIRGFADPFASTATT